MSTVRRGQHGHRPGCGRGVRGRHEPAQRAVLPLVSAGASRAVTSRSQRSTRKLSRGLATRPCAVRPAGAPTCTRTNSPTQWRRRKVSRVAGRADGCLPEHEQCPASLRVLDVQADQRRPRYAPLLMSPPPCFEVPACKSSRLTAASLWAARTVDAPATRFNMAAALVGDITRPIEVLMLELAEAEALRQGTGPSCHHAGPGACHA